MNQIVQKNFLNSLLNSTQQNLSATSFAFDLTRSAGLTFKTNGNFGSSTQLTGTNQDDTVTIGGNLIGGNYEATSIELLDGDDTVTVGGNIIAHGMQSVSLTGNLGTKTIHVNGGIDIDQSAIHMNIGNRDNLTNVNTITIDGFIKASDQANIDFRLTGKENNLNINSDINIKSGVVLAISANSNQNVINIKGNLHSDAATAYIQCELWDAKDKTAKAEINIGGNLLSSNGASIYIDAYANNTSISCKDLVATNLSNINILTDHYYSLMNNFFIDGNITATNGSSFDLTTNAKANVDITGSVIIQHSSAYFDMYGGSIAILGGISNADSDVTFNSSARSGMNVYIEGDVTATYNMQPDHYAASNSFMFGDGNVTFTLIGDLIATNGSYNELSTFDGADAITIIGDVSVSNGGINSVYTGYGDDIINLNGHIAAGALEINMDEGNDTLILTANTQKLFDENYKEWLTDLSASDSLTYSGLETIRIDVNYIQQSKLGWLTDIVNKANADGANITLEDKAGHQLVNPSAYLAQGNDSHNPINDVLDHYAPAAAAAQPKAFAENVATPSTDAFAAPYFDNNSFLHEIEQQAQAHAVAA